MKANPVAPAAAFTLCELLPFFSGERLRSRTERFHRIVKNPGDVEIYAKKTLASEDFRKRYEVIYCCEYLAFWTMRKRKWDVFLHPSKIPGSICAVVRFMDWNFAPGIFVPAIIFIAFQSQILIKIIDDWYLYGLVLTDI